MKTLERWPSPRATWRPVGRSRKPKARACAQGRADASKRPGLVVLAWEATGFGGISREEAEPMGLLYLLGGLGPGPGPGAQGAQFPWVRPATTCFRNLLRRPGRASFA